MKKLILPLMLLLLAAGFLFAVESDPSAVVGYVKYDCVPDLNLIAIPMSQGYTLVSEFADDYPGIFDTINYWDAANQVWSAANDLGFMWDNDFAIAPGAVLFVNALTASNVYSMGALPANNASYSLVSDLNTLMVPLNRSDLTMASELGTDVSFIDTINSWDAANQVWSAANDLGFMWDNDFAISIGTPLMVNALSTGTWPTRSMTPTFKIKNN